ncbi:MAG: hypothetical protein ACK6BC_03055, partial [Cyanobacteriota bacterium]
QLLHLLPGFFPHLARLLLRFLENGMAVDQLLPLPSGLGKDLFRLLPRPLNEGLLLAQQALGMGSLQLQGIPQGIDRLDGVALVDHACAAERDAAAIENDFLELVELIEDRDARVRHVKGKGLHD